MDLLTELKKIASEFPETRKHLVPLLRQAAESSPEKTAYYKAMNSIRDNVPADLKAKMKEHAAAFEKDLKDGKNVKSYVSDVERILKGLNKVLDSWET